MTSRTCKGMVTFATLACGRVLESGAMRIDLVMIAHRTQSILDVGGRLFMVRLIRCPQCKGSGLQKGRRLYKWHIIVLAFVERVRRRCIAGVGGHLSKYIIMLDSDIGMNLHVRSFQYGHLRRRLVCQSIIVQCI